MWWWFFFTFSLRTVKPPVIPLCPFLRLCNHCALSLAHSLEQWDPVILGLPEGEGLAGKPSSTAPVNSMTGNECPSSFPVLKEKLCVSPQCITLTINCKYLFSFLKKIPPVSSLPDVFESRMAVQFFQYFSCKYRCDIVV